MFAPKANSQQKRVKKGLKTQKRSSDKQKRTVVHFKMHGQEENTRSVRSLYQTVRFASESKTHSCVKTYG